MDKRAERVITGLEERLKFYSLLGVEFFLSRPQGFSLEEQIRNCRRCPLSRMRKNAVPGEGNLKAELMFVGEAPGHDEDIQGRPFVGKAGQLLTRIINAMGLRREEVYITNVVKCRPPENREPESQEVELCKGFLLEQIAGIKPMVIVALGRVATNFFIRSSLGMSDLRGQFYDFNGVKVLPTFHPSYVLRNEANKAVKKMVWEDMKKALALLGRR